MTDLPRNETQRLEQAIRDLTVEMRQFPEKMAETYVRKDVLEPRLALIDDRHEVHQQAIDSIRKNLRYVVYLVLGFIFGTLSTVVAVAVGKVIH